MKNYLRFFNVLTSVMLLGSVAIANGPDTVTLGNPAVAGSGCPAGSVDSVLSPDKTSLSILFDEFIAEAEAGDRDRKNCDVAIPVKVPQGFSVSVIDMDYRGYAYLPRGAESLFTTEYFFAGTRGPSMSERFRGPMDDEYLVNNKLIATASSWSPCGQSVILRSKASVNLNNRRGREDAEMTVDSIDASVDTRFAIKYYLSWKKCN